MLAMQSSLYFARVGCCLSLAPMLPTVQDRSHKDFIVALKDNMSCSREQLALRIAHAVRAALPGFDVQVSHGLCWLARPRRLT